MICQPRLNFKGYSRREVVSSSGEDDDVDWVLIKTQ
jgi:hypothetical protein